MSSLRKKPARADELDGRVVGHRDGHGFVVSDDETQEVLLNAREMASLMHGDRVRVRQTGIDRRGRMEGVLVDVLERNQRPIVGRVVVERSQTLVVPEDSRVRHDVFVSSKDLGGAQPGQVVVVQIVEAPQLNRPPVGRVIEVLGALDDAGMEIEIAVRKFDVPHRFSEAAEKASERLPIAVRSADVKGRVDLRDVPLVTIDGIDARDFDDAVYCEPIATAGGSSSRKRSGQPSWRLLVAIADVSHYVLDGSALDKDALSRGTSVYFPRRVLPMLPEKLSNGLCSLKPDVERLAIVCDMVIDDRGQVKGYQFFEAVIRSAARLTYDEVWSALSDPLSEAAMRRAPLMGMLRNLHSLYQLFAQAREQRGAIDFETVETFMQINDAGRIERILPRVRNDAHKLIEECMLAANVCAADFIARAKHPALFRVHEGPTADRLENLRAFLRLQGLTLEGGAQPSASDFAQLARAVRGRPDSTLLQTMMLRTMQQAHYTPDNAGHFGLAYGAYTHFTSPIRRYPDLLVHRVLRALIQGQRYTPKLGAESVDTVSVSGRGARKGTLPAETAGNSELVAKWRGIGARCSAAERRADDASRDVEAWLKCQYMRERVGEQFAGRITGVAPFGVFVTLESLFVEGMVHISELGTDYFQYNEALHELRGERTGRRYRLCDDVNVLVSRVDLEARRVEFQLTKGLGPRDIARENGGRSSKSTDATSAPDYAEIEAALGPSEAQSPPGRARKPSVNASRTVRKKKAAPGKSAAVKAVRAARAVSKRKATTGGEARPTHGKPARSKKRIS